MLYIFAVAFIYWGNLMESTLCCEEGDGLNVGLAENSCVAVLGIWYKWKRKLLIAC